MTYDEYWNQEPWLAADYRKAWDLQQKEQNYTAWLSGLYVHKAVGVVIQNAFRKKGSQAEKYFEKPIDFVKEESHKSAKEIRQDVYERLKRMEEAWNGRRTNIKS